MVIILVGNKKDLEHKRAVSTQEGEGYAKEHGMLFLEVSAKTGDHVEEAFVSTSAKVLELLNNGTFDLNDEVRLNLSLLLEKLTGVCCCIQSHGIKLGMKNGSANKAGRKSGCC
jgi:GTPase SAR1 family protein